MQSLQISLLATSTDVGAEGNGRAVLAQQDTMLGPTLIDVV